MADVASGIEALLRPIQGPNPSGADLRYSPAYDDLRAKRRAVTDKAAALTEDARAAAEAARKAGDPSADAHLSPSRLVQLESSLREWAAVEEAAGRLLSTISKDLQIAAWLAEALASQRGFAGATAGIIVVRRMLEEFWDTLYPAVDTDDDDPLGFRLSPMEWLDDRLSAVLKATPLTERTTGYGLIHFEMARGQDAQLGRTQEGWPARDIVNAALARTSRASLEASLQEVRACTAEVEALRGAASDRFGERATTFRGLLDVLGNCARLLRSQTEPAEDPAPSITAATHVERGVDGHRTAGRADAVWERALQLVRESRLDGLKLAQDHIDTAATGRERFLRQLALGELCVEAGMHAFAYPVLDELGRTIDDRRLEDWEDPALIRRVWTSLAEACRPLVRMRPESARRREEAESRLAAIEGVGAAESDAG